MDVCSTRVLPGYELERRPEFAASKVFIVWNLLGILDLLSAIGTGTTSSLLAARVAGEVTTAPMAELPLALIPAFLVPISSCCMSPH